MFREKNFIKILTAGLYLAPLTMFVFLKHTIFPLVTLKVFTFNIVVEVIFAFWLLFIVFYPQYRPKFTKLSVTLFVFIGALFLSAIFGVNFSRSLWSVPGRAIGLFGLVHFTALFIILKSLAPRFNWRRYLIYIFGISLAVALFAIVQKYQGGSFLFEVRTQSRSRPGSFLGNPAFFASYILLTIFVGGWLALTTKNKKRRVVFWGAVLVEIFTLFISGTRGAILGFFAGIFVLLIYYSWRRYRRLRNKNGVFQALTGRNLFFIFIIALIVFTGIFIKTREARIWQAVPGLDRVATISLNDITTSDRLLAWETAWRAFLEKPIFGWGFENFKYGFDKHYDTRFLNSGLNETFWDKPHNIFLEYLSTTGILGLGAYLSLLIAFGAAVIYKMPKSFRPIGLAFIAGYAGSEFFIFDTFGSYFVLFVVIAFVDSFVHKGEVGGESPSLKPRPARLGAAALLILGSAYLVFLNIQIIRANNFQYHGINFLLNQKPEESMASYDKALAIKEPYKGEIQFSFLATLSDSIDSVSIPDIEDRIKQALAGANEAISKDPDNYRGYIQLAEAKTNFNKINPNFYKGAEEDIKKAITLSSNRQENYYALAQARMRTGNQSGAYTIMKKAVDLNAGVGEPHFYYGLLALQAGDKETGWKEIKLAEKLGRTPHSANEYRVLANFYGDNEEYEKAIDYYQKALSLRPLDMEARLKLGIVYYYNNQFGEARPLFEDVFRARPDFIGSDNYNMLRPIFRAVGAI